MGTHEVGGYGFLSNVALSILISLLESLRLYSREALHYWIALEYVYEKTCERVDCK